MHIANPHTKTFSAAVWMRQSFNMRVHIAGISQLASITGASKNICEFSVTAENVQSGI
jgi:hypothetical protein